MKYKALIKLSCIYSSGIENGEIFEIKEIQYGGKDIRIITLDDKNIPLDFLKNFCIELTGEEAISDNVENRETYPEGQYLPGQKFREGQNVWDTKYKEVFRYVNNRDKIIEDRLENYSHQDGCYSEMCDCGYCKCQQ